MKAVLRGKFIAKQAYLKKLETFQINNLTLALQKLEERQQRKPRASRRKEIVKIRSQLNDIETKRTIQRINKSLFFEKINKIKKHLISKKKRKRTLINKIRNKREITTNAKETQRIVRNYYEQLYAKKLDDLGKMYKFVETFSFPKLNQEEAESLKRLISGS